MHASPHTHNDFRGIFPQVSAVPSAANMHEYAFRTSSEQPWQRRARHTRPLPRCGAM